MLFTLQNEYLTVTVSSLGAELQSVRGVNGTEFIWNADPAVWGSHAPVLFPICGGLRDDCYTHDGKSYTLPKHGFARCREFTPEQHESHFITLRLDADAETLASYPFLFVFRVTFLLVGRTLSVRYEVENRGAAPLYYSCGAHEAYATPEGLEAYSVRFDAEEELQTSVLDGNLLSDTLAPVPLEDGHTLPLRRSYFAVDALVFRTVRSKRVTLFHTGSTRRITVDFEADHLLLWTKPNGDYLCIEPWCGLPDTYHSTGVLAEKESIHTVAPGRTGSQLHRVTFFE